MRECLLRAPIGSRHPGMKVRHMGFVDRILHLFGVRDEREIRIALVLIATAVTLLTVTMLVHLGTHALMKDTDRVVLQQLHEDTNAPPRN